MRRPFQLTLVSLILSNGLMAAPPPAVHGELAITFGATTVTASGLTPGAKAVVFAIARIGRTYDYSTERYVKVISDDRHDGTITFDLRKPIPPRSIWAIVDLTSGHYGVAGPDGFYLDFPAPPKVPLRHDAAGKVNIIAIDHPVLDLLYVHPGIGAWTLGNIREGDRHDRDGPNGIAAVSLDDAAQIADGPAHPGEVVPGGVIIAFDWYKMQVVPIRLDGSLIGGAQ